MDSQELIIYEPLREEFMGRGSQRGWRFRMLRREGLYAMYVKKNDVEGRHEGKSMEVYEVIKIRLSKGRKAIIAGVEREFKSCEVYPSDEEFGSYGWCYVRECDALARYEALVGEKS